MCHLELGVNTRSKLLNALNLNEFTLKHADTTDGVRLTLTNDYIIHLRLLGNASKLRCYTESNNAKQLALNVLSKVKSYVTHVVA